MMKKKNYRSRLVRPSRAALMLSLFMLLILAACAPPPAVQTRIAESSPPVRQQAEGTPTAPAGTVHLPLVTDRASETESESESEPAEELFAEVDLRLPDDAVRVQFDLSEVSKVLSGTLAAGEVDTFVLRANGGEPLLIDLVSEGRTLQFSLYGLEDGIPLVHDSAGLTRWAGQLPRAQEYVLHVTAEGVTIEPDSNTEANTAVKNRPAKLTSQSGTPYQIHISQPQRITFAPGQNTASVSKSLAVGQILPYVVNVAQGQWLQVAVNSPNQSAVLSVQGMTDGIPYQDGLVTGTSFWLGQATMSQDFLLRVLPSSGTPEFTLTVSVTDQRPTGQPAPPNQPQPLPGAPTFINLAPGNTATNLPSQLTANGIATYALRGVAGQGLAINATAPTNSVFLTIYGATDGLPLASAANGVQSWMGILPTTQDYIVLVMNTGPATNYTLSVIIPERVTFAPGSISTVKAGMLGPTGFIHYVFRANAGQTLDLSVQSDNDNVMMRLVGVSDGVTLGNNIQGWRGTLPQTQDYAVIVTNVGLNPSNYTLITAVR